METPGGGAAGPADRAMRIDVVTLFPAMVGEAAKVGITGRAGTRATSRPTRTARWTTGRMAAGRGW
jgi:hypothetical protein